MVLSLTKTSLLVHARGGVLTRVKIMHQMMDLVSMISLHRMMNLLHFHSGERHVLRVVERLCVSPRSSWLCKLFAHGTIVQHSVSMLHHLPYVPTASYRHTHLHDRTIFFITCFIAIIILLGIESNYLVSVGD